MHRSASQTNPSLTQAQISDEIAGYFQQSNDINQGYLRRTFDCLDNALARKGKAALPTISENEAGPSQRAPQPTTRKTAAPRPGPEAPPPRPVPPPQNATGTSRSSRGGVPSRKLAR